MTPFLYILAGFTWFRETTAEGALKYAKEKPNGIVVGWMHGDEPDKSKHAAAKKEQKAWAVI